MAEVSSTTVAPVAQSPPTPAVSEIMDPLTGELIRTDDVDGLVDLFESLKKQGDAICVARIEVQRALASQVPGEKKTERIVGRRRAVKIEHPSTTWDSSKLKEAWNSYPQFRDQYLSLGTITPKLVEVKKLKGTQGPPDLETFKNIVMSAERAPTGNPSITIEK